MRRTGGRQQSPPWASYCASTSRRPCRRGQPGSRGCVTGVSPATPDRHHRLRAPGQKAGDRGHPIRYPAGAASGLHSSRRLPPHQPLPASAPPASIPPNGRSRRRRRHPDSPPIACAWPSVQPPGPRRPSHRRRENFATQPLRTIPSRLCYWKVGKSNSRTSSAHGGRPSARRRKLPWTPTSRCSRNAALSFRTRTAQRSN